MEENKKQNDVADLRPEWLTTCWSEPIVVLRQCLNLKILYIFNSSEFQVDEPICHC